MLRHNRNSFERHKVLIKLSNGSNLPNPLIRSLDSSIHDLIKMIRLECSVRKIFPQIEQTNFILQIDSTECVHKHYIFYIFKGRDLSFLAHSAIRMSFYRPKCFFIVCLSFAIV